MTKIKKNIIFIYNNKNYTLDASLLDLYTEYMNMYTMEYLRTSLDVLQEIREKFRIYELAKYFGSRRNLSCIQTRDMYNQMVDYFTTLFEKQMYEHTHINTNNINDNDKYTCLIAECLSLIRGSIRKYARYRTALNQPYICSKNKLNHLNSTGNYKCPYPINDIILCPTFAQVFTPCLI